MAVRDLIVRVVGDDSKFVATMKHSTATATKFEKTIQSVGVTATESANAQIAAAKRRDARLREEASLYRQVAAAAEKGSREQIIATNLAERADRQLARSLGVTAAESRKLSASTVRFEKDLSRATRGALAGSGIFSKFGRSLAFASGGFLAFSGVSSFLRSSIDAAKEEQVTERQLATQFRANRRELEPYRREIERFTDALSAKSGFENDQLVAGLTTILRTQPNVTKALRDEATAADLARAKNISLAAASTIVAKVEGGNTTLLRRQGIQVAKNATAEQALATLREKVAGQAAAGATEQEKFGAVLHRTEEIIGLGILPTLNRYLVSGTKWLEQMNESGKLQRDVAKSAREFETAVHDVGAVVKTVDGITGSFKNTLELLLALKTASIVTGWAGAFAHAASEEGKASKAAAVLRTRLALLPTTIAITIGIEVLLNKKKVDTTVGNFLDKHGLGFLGGTKENHLELPATVTLSQLDESIAKLSKFKGSGDLMVKTLEKLRDEIFKTADAAPTFADRMIDAGGKAERALNLAADAATNARNAVTHPVHLTRSQQNQFFDARTQREIDRAARLGIDEQIGALDKIEERLKARLAKTKDITRQLNLEDQIQSIEDQKADVRKQLHQNFVDALSGKTAGAEFAVQIAQATATVNDDIRALLALERAIEAEIRVQGRTTELAQSLFETRQQLAAARAERITQRQFTALGLTPEGEKRTPGVRALRRELGTIEDKIAGTFLDTSKTQSLLARVRRVLSGGLGKVGEDVRKKIQEILGGLNSQLDQTTQKNLTKWRHLSTQAFLAGIPDLTPAQKRQLEARLATLGPGGVVPGASTPAFALAGGRVTDRGGNVYMDGEKVGTITKSHQNRRGAKRTIPRNG